MADFRRILTCVFEGLSYRDIAAAAGCSFRDIKAARDAITAEGLTQEKLTTLTDADLAGLFPDGRSRVSDGYAQPEFNKVATSIGRNPNYTLYNAWLTYVQQPNTRGLKTYSYSQFCALFSDFVDDTDVVSRLLHEPGRLMFVDWAGDKLHVTDFTTGKKYPASLFVAQLPYSGMIFAKAYRNEKMPSWIQGHVDALAYFGGVPVMIVPDNATTASFRPVKGDPAREVAGTYQRLGNHYQCAVFPTRVRKPRDKAGVESAVSVCTRMIIGYLADEQFATVGELNDRIAQRLEEINHRPFRGGDDSRWSLFLREECDQLAALPSTAFADVRWEQRTVGRDYHVIVDYQHYSVPYRLAGKKVHVRATGEEIAVFFDHEMVADHARRTGSKGQYSTNPDHAPVAHKDIDSLWSRQWFIRQASHVGPMTRQVIDAMIDQAPMEAHAFLACNNILELAKRTGYALTEAAYTNLVAAGGRYSYTAVKNMVQALKSSDQVHTPPTPVDLPATAAITSPDAHVRGADYYRDL